jgi:hypothetical protein
MKKTITNCLRKLCCNFCFMLLGTFSKAEISTKAVMKENSNSIELIKKLNHNTFYDEFYNICSSHKNPFVRFPKKRKKAARQSDFEIKVLPKGEYTAQLDNNNNVIITKKIISIK